MKNHNLILSIIVAIFLLSCSDRILDNSEREYYTGTVKYVSLEGGFWAIYGDNNKHYDPINLPKEFWIEGKRIQFSFRERNDLASFHMWGVIIELIEIKEIK